MHCRHTPAAYDGHAARQPAFLPAAQRLAWCMALRLQLETVKHVLDLHADGSGVCEALEPAEEPQVLLYRQVVKKDVVLWAHPEQPPRPGQVGPDVVRPDVGRAGRRRQLCGGQCLMQMTQVTQ